MPPFAPSRRPRSQKAVLTLLALMFIVALIALVAAVRTNLEQRAAHNTPNPIALTADTFRTARQNYDLHCASCHGSTGNGRGDKADSLWSKPTDFRDGTKMSRRTDGDLYWVTTKGDWPMPAFERKLGDLERWQLVAYIRTFGPAPGSQ